jgi:hypothetical protein
MLYDGTTTTQIADDSEDDPRINDNGYVVWSGSDGSDDEIFLYDGTTTTQLTDNGYADTDPQINNSGYVVWQRHDGSDYEIMLYDGSSTTQITDNVYQDYHPQINNNGYVVWKVGEGTATELFVYDGTTTTQIRNPNRNDHLAQINDNGYVVWKAYQGGQMEIFLGVPTLAIYQCSIVPDATVVSKRSSLGFEVTVTNNTDEAHTFMFATNVKFPNGSSYPPPPAYLRGPYRVRLDPYESISRHLSQYVGNAPPTTYTYHGYVGTRAVGIYQECQFEFEVIE